MVEEGLLSISEFSHFTGIPRSKLIYYDEIGLFTPALRGQNNYRYYGLSQIVTANFITDLTSLGLSLAMIKELAKTRTPKKMLEVLKEENQRCLDLIQELEETQNLILITQRLISAGIDADENSVSVRTLEPLTIIPGLDNEYQDSQSFYPAWLDFLAKSQEKGYNIKFPVGGMFETAELFFERPAMPTRFYFINPGGNMVRPKGEFLVGFARGYYGETGDLRDRMLDYAKQHKLKLGGPVYNSYLLDEISIVDHDNYLMQASIPVIRE